MNLLKASILCLGMTCMSAATGAEGTPAAGVSSSAPTANVGGRAVVVYFSCTGTTAALAERIAQATGATTWRIEPAEPYTQADLDYEVANSRANREQQDPTSRPAIIGRCPAIAGSRIVFLGYPIWWGEAPRVISTFLAQHDLAGKIIVPFCTSGTSPLGESAQHLHSLAPQATWKPGKRFNGSESIHAIRQWLEHLRLPGAPSVAGSPFTLSEGRNGQAPSVILSDGQAMPVLGLGTYSLRGENCLRAVSEALAAGYRKFDTAHIYSNEAEVGQAIRASGVPREQVAITTKLYPHQYRNAADAIEQSLRQLGLGYIDLMMLHHPGPGDTDAYHTIEQYRKAGKIRSIGLSNYYEQELDIILPCVSVRPAVVQNEIHPYYQEQSTVDFLHRQGIIAEAWYPLGGRGYTAQLLTDPTLRPIAQRHGKSTAQIVLRWLLQRGIAAIPGSGSPAHIRENMDIFDFSLSQEDMQHIRALDRNEKHDWY